MNSIGTENLSTKLTLPELLIKQVAEQIVNEQLLYNLNLNPCSNLRKLFPLHLERIF